MRNLQAVAAMMALASAGAVIRVSDDEYGEHDEKVLLVDHGEKMRLRSEEISDVIGFNRSPPTPRRLDTSLQGLERQRLAAERRSAKIARQAGGFVTAKAGTDERSVEPRAEPLSAAEGRA